MRRSGAGWAKHARAAARHRANIRETDERDVGGLRIDLGALLAAPVEDFADYDVDTVIAERSFRASAARWFARAA